MSDDLIRKNHKHFTIDEMEEYVDAPCRAIGALFNICIETRKIWREIQKRFMTR